MGLKPETAGLLGAGLPLVGGIISAIAQSQQNKKTRQWTEKMYGLQRQHSLEDWAMQNAYNHPSAQMARLRESGLNPNLVYGNGATTDAGPIRSSNVESWKPDAPTFEFMGAAAGSGLAAYQQTRIQEQQIDNMRAQKTLTDVEAALKKAQEIGTYASTANTLQNTARSKFDLEQAVSLKDVSVDAAKANLAKTLADTQYTLDNNARQEALQKPHLAKIAAETAAVRQGISESDTRIQKMKEEISQLQKEGKLKDLEILLKQNGLTWSDPYWVRALVAGQSIVDQAMPGMKANRRPVRDAHEKLWKVKKYRNR